MRQPVDTKRMLLGTVALLGFVLASGFQSLWGASSNEKIDGLLSRGRQFEANGQWQAASQAYRSALELQSGNVVAREGYFRTLRRWLQDRRHRLDPSYSRELLPLRFAQALKLYEYLLSYLAERSATSASPSTVDLFREGLTELRFALENPHFVKRHLGKIDPAAIRSFREEIDTYWSRKQVRDVSEAVETVRSLAKSAARKLRLRMTATVMEFVFGSCQAVDPYSMYLTPSQVRVLCQSLKGEYVATVRHSVLDAEGHPVGYLAIRAFNEATVAEVDEALVALAKENVRGLVLDLRDNSGGLVESAVEVARRFLSSGIIATVKSESGKASITYHADNSHPFDLPMVVIVNGKTASAGEVLVGALKENRRARVVGRTTFGKGCMQDLYRIVGVSGKVYPGGVLVTISRFYSPSGAPYAGRGVEPDVYVPIEALNDAQKGDRSLETAVQELVQSLMMMDMGMPPQP